MKNISLITTAIFLFIGCGQKPIVVKGKIDRPTKIKTTKKPSPILGKPIGSVSTNPLENPSVIMGQEVKSLDLNQSTIPVVDNNTNTIGAVEEIGEAIMDPSLSQSYVTTLKTKKFSFSDAGFMREDHGVIDLQILTAGKPLVTLKISSDVCVDHNCISKEEFNHEYLSSSYPPDLINNVLTRRPIFDGKNLKRTSNGFMQKITSQSHDIKYKTTPSSIYFKDLKNNLIIKMRRLK
jgi:hypothetical protein